ncbi:MAG TPA: hypothetical protein VGE72_15180 [Azospirillum sp.]
MSLTISFSNYTGKITVAPASPATIVTGQFTVYVDGMGWVTVAPLDSSTLTVSDGSQTQRSGYNGGTSYSLSIDINGNWWLADGAGTSLLSGRLAGGPAGRLVPATVPGSGFIQARCVTNAGYTERVTVTVDGGQTYCWKGTGEEDILLYDGAIAVPGTAGNSANLWVLMEYSDESGNTWYPSKMPPVGAYSYLMWNQRLLLSEDYDDNDYNDAALLLQWWG